MPRKHHATIRVGQRLLDHDGAYLYGYVALNTKGVTVFGPDEPFKVEWIGLDGELDDAEYHTLASLAAAGIRRGRGVMPWAR